jgi:hypothetical protein
VRPGYLLRKGLLNSAPNRKDEPTQYIYFLYSSANCTEVAKLTFGAMHALQIKISKKQGKNEIIINKNLHPPLPEGIRFKQ